MIGTKFDKPLQDDYIIDPETHEKSENPAPNTLSKYSAAATWCNENHAKIDDMGEYYEVVAIPEPTLDKLKENKLNALTSAFKSARQEAYITSSLGFKADANETANDDINGLITVMGDLGQVDFMDYDNQVHKLGKTQLETLREEVILNGQSLYSQKWAIRDLISAAESKAELDEIEIEFTMMDFSE